MKIRGDARDALGQSLQRGQLFDEGGGEGRGGEKEKDRRAERGHEREVVRL